MCAPLRGAQLLKLRRIFWRGCFLPSHSPFFLSYLFFRSSVSPFSHFIVEVCGQAFTAGTTSLRTGRLEKAVTY
jgi:hypothetical protein